jgi:hypothetical protein
MTVGILAVGVAGIATIWSVFHELYLKPLPIPDCGRMVILNESAPGMQMDHLGIPPPDGHAWRANNPAFTQDAEGLKVRLPQLP